jgi:hypothetical protein
MGRTYAEVREIPGLVFNLAWVLGLEFLEWTGRAGDQDELMALFEEVVRNGETNATGGTGDDDDLRSRHVVILLERWL